MDGFGQWQPGFGRGGPPNLGPRPPPHGSPRPPPHGSPFHPTEMQRQPGADTGHLQNQNTTVQHFPSGTVGGTSMSQPGYAYGNRLNIRQQQQENIGQRLPFHQGNIDSFVPPNLSSNEQQFSHSRSQIDFRSGQSFVAEGSEVQGRGMYNTAGPPTLEQNCPQATGNYADHGARGHFDNTMQSKQQVMQHGTGFHENFPSQGYPHSDMHPFSGNSSDTSSVDQTAIGRGFTNDTFRHTYPVNQMSMQAFPPQHSQAQETHAPKQRLPLVPPPPLPPPFPSMTGQLSFASKVMQTASTHGPSLGQNSPHGMTSSAGKTQAEIDKEWLAAWLSKRGLEKGKTKVVKCPDMTLPEVRQKLSEWRSLLDQLTEQKTVLTKAVGADESKWQFEMRRATKIKDKLAKVESTFGNEELLTQLDRKLTRIQKKRARLRRLREESYRRRQETSRRCEERHQQIDKWRNNILQKDLDAKREAELKKEVDDTLSEVRRKQSEATKATELLKSLGKLRKLRKEANERKGVKTSSEAERVFESKLQDYVDMMGDRCQMYGEEERMLRAVVEEEQEEERERYRQARKKKEEREARKKEARQLEMLFGPKAPLDPDDPLLPYRQYYEQAEHSVQALIHIRREWDMYLVPEGTIGATTVPTGWVVPSEPSSEGWAGRLKENLE